MHRFISFDHQVIDAEKASLSVVSSAALYGRGIFTTLGIYGSKPFLWEKHWRRLNDDAEKIGLDFTSFSEDKVKDSLDRLIGRNRLTEGRARLTFFDESSGGIWAFETERRTNCLITTTDLQPIKEELLLCVSAHPLNSASPLAGVKSCNYLENLLALEDARKGGFDEAIRLNERGEIAAACLANIFWIKKGVIFTPSLETGCLSGTTRNFLAENFDVFEIKARLDELFEADQIFLTSSGLGISRAKFPEAENQGQTTFLKLKKFFDSEKAR